MIPPLQPDRGGIEVRGCRSGLAADEQDSIVGNYGPWSEPLFQHP